MIYGAIACLILAFLIAGVSAWADSKRLPREPRRAETLTALHISVARTYLRKGRWVTADQIEKDARTHPPFVPEGRGTPANTHLRIRRN